MTTGGGRRRREAREAKAYHIGPPRLKMCRQCGRTYPEFWSSRCRCGGEVRWASGRESRGQ